MIIEDLGGECVILASSLHPGSRQRHRHRPLRLEQIADFTEQRGLFLQHGFDCAFISTRAA